MNRAVTSIAFFFVLSLSTPALANDYLSQDRDDWFRYAEAQTNQVVTSRLTYHNGSWSYWENFAGLGNRWLYTYSNNDWMWLYDHQQGYSLLPTLSGTVGYYRTVNLDPANHGRARVKLNT